MRSTVLPCLQPAQPCNSTVVLRLSLFDKTQNVLEGGRRAELTVQIMQAVPKPSLCQPLHRPDAGPRPTLAVFDEYDAPQGLHVPHHVEDGEPSDTHEYRSAEGAAAVGAPLAHHQHLWQVFMFLLLEAATLLHFYRTSTDASTSTGTVQYCTVQYAYRQFVLFLWY